MYPSLFGIWSLVTTLQADIMNTSPFSRCDLWWQRHGSYWHDESFLLQLICGDNLVSYWHDRYSSVLRLIFGDEGIDNDRWWRWQMMMAVVDMALSWGWSLAILQATDVIDTVLFRVDLWWQPQAAEEINTAPFWGWSLVTALWAPMRYILLRVDLSWQPYELLMQ